MLGGGRVTITIRSRFIPSKGTDDEDAVGGQPDVSMEAHGALSRVESLNGNSSITEALTYGMLNHVSNHHILAR